MKKILFVLALTLASVAMYAVGLEGVRIYVNPGHGSWDPGTCRGLSTIPYQIDGDGVLDTCGFFESNTNLWKSLELGKKLEAAGAVVFYSRTANGPYPFPGSAKRAEYKARDDREMYDRSISEIAEEVEVGNYDYFISIHSNANTDGTTTNFPIILYRGYDNDTTRGAGDSKYRAKVLWPYLFEAMESGIDPYTAYSKTNPNVRGDINFMRDSVVHTHPNGQVYVGYYAVLRHSVPGYLSEGYFHTYQPARHRALNADYCRQEGVRYYRGIAAYYNHPAETKGYIMGTVKDLHQKINHSLFTYNPGTNDIWMPCNSAIVTLYKGGEKVADYKVDDNYNGVFVFSDLEPGNDYTLDATCEGYKPLFDVYKEKLTVKANETTYPLIFLESESYDPNAETTDELNVYASGLQLETVADGKAKISYVLNARAISLEFQVLNATDGSLVKTIAISGQDVLKGAHTDVEIDLADIPAGTYQWALKTSATPRKTMSSDFVAGLPGYSFYQPRGLEVNVNPENPYFGYTYLTNSDEGAPSATPSVTTVSGIHILDPQLVYQGGYQGGVTWAGTQRAAGVAWQQREKGAYRVQIDEEGLVYANDNYSATTGIWVMDPANPSANFTPVLGLPKTNFTQINCFEVLGSGVDRKLVILDNASTFKSYAIGEHTNYVETGIVFADYAAGTDLTSLESDGHGGYWFIRAITESGEKACLVHFNAEGVEDYSLKLGNSTFATLNLNKDKTLLALSHNNDKVGKVYSIEWSDGIPASSVPKLTELYTFNLGTNYITAVAFDYANNLYVGSHYSERFHAFALPTDNVCTTPAPKASVFAVEGASSNLYDAKAEQVEVHKVMENGTLVIIKNGVRYNVMGVKLHE